MNIITKTEGGTSTIVLSGWLDTSTAPELAAAVAAIGDDATQLVIDCAQLEYISSAGLRQLVAAHKKMQGKLTLVNVSSEIRDVLHMGGFDRFLNIV